MLYNSIEILNAAGVKRFLLRRLKVGHLRLAIASDNSPIKLAAL